MTYYIIAGEASGDLHGSNLIKELKKLDHSAEIRAWGGDKMQAQGATLVKHYRDLAFMGFVEVVRNLPTILRNLKFCKADILRFQPQVLILIDYPGFNLRIAKWAKQQGFKVIYYISPQVWAWKENRVKQIRETVDKMLVILPFEKEFYKIRDYQVEYIGHPLVQVVEDFKKSNTDGLNFDRRVIALLPGSRKQEIIKKLPIMLGASKNFPQYQFVIARASSLPNEYYQPFLQEYPDVKTVHDKTYALLSIATAALVTSGTATLETALFGVPEVVCYKGSSVSYQIAKRLIKIKYISLVNLIMDKTVVTELIQDELTTENVVKELGKLLNDEQKIAEMKKDYADLKALLKQGGNASEKAAGYIIAYLDQDLPDTKD